MIACQICVLSALPWYKSNFARGAVMKIYIIIYRVEQTSLLYEMWNDTWVLRYINAIIGIQIFSTIFTFITHATAVIITHENLFFSETIYKLLNFLGFRSDLTN